MAVIQRTAVTVRIVTFITEAAAMRRILHPIGEPAEPPWIAPAREPPALDDLLEPLPDWDALAPPAPEFEFAQPISG